jgi:hypothetical protein
MSNGVGDPAKAAQQNIDRANAAGKAVYDILFGTYGESQAALGAAVDTVSHSVGHSTAIKNTIDSFVQLLNPLLAAFFAVLSDVRHGVTDSMGDATAEVLNEFLGTDFTADVLKNGQGADATLQKCQAIGAAVLGRLEQEFSGAPGQTTGPGAKAAQTFAGYGVNFGIQNAIISIIGSLVPETRLDEVRELGVEVAQNLGLGRLMRVALRPLVQSLIATPYLRELNTKYRPNLLNDAEALAAWHASRVDQASVFTWLQSLGHTDDLIKERLEQTRQRLTAQEWNTLTALAKQGDDPAAYDDQAKGMDDDWITLRQAVLTWQRLRPIRDRVLSELLPQIKQGFVTIQTLQGLLQRLNLPQDEQSLWLEAAGTFLEVPRKRPSQADMLFLYEASQITDDDVQIWLQAEGYGREDVQRMLTFFRLKFVASTQGVSPARAAHLANVHLEHIAYVTDEITGLWSRPPTPAELNYWVKLLDSDQRTKHDFLIELKGLPTTGPAMP